MNAKISLNLLLGFSIMFFSSYAASEESSGLSAVPNNPTDKHRYVSPDQNKKDICSNSDPRNIGVFNSTQYVLYYDFRSVSGNERALVDWRIEPNKGWNHCRDEDHYLELDYDLSTPGIQMRSFLLKPNTKYELFEESSLIIGVRRR